MTRGKTFSLVLQPPGERRHRPRSDAGAVAQGLGRLARGGSADHLVASSFEAFSHRRQRARLTRTGYADHQVQGVARSEQGFGHLGLSLGETEARDSSTRRMACGAPGHRRRRPALGEHVGQLGDAPLVLQHAGRRPYRFPGAGHRGKRDGLLVVRTFSTALSRTETGSPCRSGATATMTSRRVKVFSGQAATGGEQLGGDVVDDVPLGGR